MKVKMNKTFADEGFYVGDIVDAKRFSEFTYDEANIESGIPEIWNGDEIFLKLPKVDATGCNYRYLCDNKTEGVNFDILEEPQDETDKLLSAATEAKNVYDKFIEVGFSKKQAFDFVAIVLGKSLTN